MSYFEPTRFQTMPPVVKNLIIINVLMFLATWVFKTQGLYLQLYLGMFPFQSSYFEPYQIVTHMFMHADVVHIFFNMFALWMFGSVLENVWGPKKFLFFYLVTGLGAALLHQGVNAYEIFALKQKLADNYSLLLQSQIDEKLMGFAVGASGAVYGILLAFGMLFPNSTLMIYGLIPVKAKYLVTFLAIFALYKGFSNNPTDNVAHFAHLGGMLFGFILMKIWQKDRTRFY